MKINKTSSLFLIPLSVVILTISILRLNNWNNIKKDLFVSGVNIIDFYYFILSILSIIAAILSIYLFAKLKSAIGAANSNSEKWSYYIIIVLNLIAILGLIASSFIEASFIQSGLKQAF
ncbi:MAG: hypothetical protein Q8O75_03430 [bacterium]|nr:hypothetical protein [bacterium]